MYSISQQIELLFGNHHYQYQYYTPTSLTVALLSGQNHVSVWCDFSNTYKNYIINNYMVLLSGTFFNLKNM